jgi:hypothetical protein
MSLFTKVEIERDKKDIHILIRCGIGDTLAYLARLDSLLKVYPQSRIYFHVGGFRKIPEMIAAQQGRAPAAIWRSGRGVWPKSGWAENYLGAGPAAADNDCVADPR